MRRLLIELKRGGMVASQKGPSGGYVLARHPAKITMADVVQMIEGDYVPVECLEQGVTNTLCQRGDGCAMRNVWCEVRDSVNAIATEILAFMQAENQDRDQLRWISLYIFNPKDNAGLPEALLDPVGVGRFP